MSSSKRLPKPTSSDILDDTICQQMSSLVELLVTSGKPVLIPEVMKKFKKLCRTSDDYVRYAQDLLMLQLVQDHSEIRLTALQMVDELFNRSHAFRDKILEDFQTFMELTLDCEHNCPLPPPKQAASKLKEEAVRYIQQWNDKFGEAYKKLSLGHQYLKTCKKVNFDEVLARLETERLQREETQRKLEEARLMKLEQVKNEMNDLTPDIELCLKEIENCIQLLMPHPDTFFIPEPEKPDLTMGLLNKTDEQMGAIESSENKRRLKTDSDYLLDNTGVVGKCDKCKCNTSQALKDDDNVQMTTSGTSDQVEDTIKKVCSCDKHSSTMLGEHDPCASENANIENSKRPGDCQEQTPLESSAIINQKSENVSGENNVRTQQSDYNGIGCSDMGADAEEDGNDDEDDDDFQEVGAHAELRQAYGLGSRDYQISVTIGGDDRLKETEDNTYIIQSLKDQYRLVKNKYLGVIKKCIKTMESNKAGKEDIESSNDLKKKLEEALKKCVELEILANPDKQNDDSDSDEDFEEVVEKEGYEEDVPEHLRLQGLEKPSTSKQTGSKSKGKSSKRSSDSKSASSSSKRLKSIASKAIASQQESSFDQALNESDQDMQDEKFRSHIKSPNAKKSNSSKERHKSSLKKGDSSTSSCSASKQKASPDNKGKATPSYWSLNCRLQEEDLKDPTSWKANITKIKEKVLTTSSAADVRIKEEPDDTELFTPDTSVNANLQKTTVKKDLYEKTPVKKELIENTPMKKDDPVKTPNLNDLRDKAPVIPFGKDLEHWENPDQIEAPLEVNYEAGRFWIANETTDKDQKQKVAALTMRSISYTGEFQPVKWKCRAPLPSGKLCERMDREKCPFHGKIIGRDKSGRPTDPADTATLIKTEPAHHTETAEDGNEASDTELLGNQMKTKVREGKGKGKGKKKASKWGFPGLTDTTQSKDTCRHRLETKVFKKTTMKRVNADLDRMDFKRVRDKFGNQFNYSLH